MQPEHTASPEGCALKMLFSFVSANMNELMCHMGAGRLGMAKAPALRVLGLIQAKLTRAFGYIPVSALLVFLHTLTSSPKGVSGTRVKSSPLALEKICHFTGYCSFSFPLLSAHFQRPSS